jgi:hypothetical protein
VAAVAALRESDPRRLSQLFRGELDWIVMKCLEKDRNPRYQTANGLAQDVQRYLANDRHAPARHPAAQALAGSAAYLFRNEGQGKFRLDGQPHLRTSGMGSGALFVDLTNSGRLDLYVSTCAVEGKAAVRKLPSYLFRNEGQGKFTDVSRGSGATLPAFAGRGVAALDFDGDGLLDLVFFEPLRSRDDFQKLLAGFDRNNKQ